MNLMILKAIALLGAIKIAESIQINAAQQQHSTIIEKNHFYSNYEINTTYDIAKVNVDKPIILYLKKKDDNQVFDNNIDIDLISGDKHSLCTFTSFDKMCFLNNLPNPNMKLKIKCQHLPCEVSWTILQPAMTKVKEQQQISDLFDISESNKHMIAMVSCNNPEIKNFTAMVKAYSENDYTRGVTNNILYYLFSKEKQGHLYFKIQEAAKSCAQMAVYNVDENIAENKQLKDFIMPNSKSVFKFQTRPTKQLRFDASIHEFNKDPITSQLNIKILGSKDGGSEEEIISQNIKPGFATTVYDFSFVTPPIKSDYNNLRVEFRTDNKILMLNFQLHEGVAQIEQAEHSHFAMNAGDIIDYRLVANQKASEDAKLKIILANTDKARQNKQQCSKKDGCSFQITAVTDVKSLLYIGESKLEISKKEIIYTQFSDKVTHKIREDDTFYLKKNVKKDKYFQIIVNNPNVILYASSPEKCDVPTRQCYQKIGNIHNPFIYGPKKDGTLLIAVQGLENCQFTITALNEGQDGIELKDNEPFAYLMDDQESSLTFKFSLPEKDGVSFNLIAPLNDLLLIVKEGKQNPDPDEDRSSIDGYISFSKKQVTKKQFRIMVMKTQGVKQKFVHFTLIASTNGANLKLDPGVAHYQTLKTKESRDLVFQFDKAQDYLVNFYIYNMAKKEDIKVYLLVSNKDQWTDKKVKHFQIQDETDVLNLKDVSQELCEEEGEVSCQIFIRLVNSMDIDLDMTITLMVKDSVIELKDGIWQTFSLNEIAKSSHFFFLPKNQKKSVSVVYRSSYVDLGIVYSIWKSDQKTISPTQWPFPQAETSANSKMDQFKSINHIIIDHESLKQCWPSCIVLVSLYKKHSGLKGATTGLTGNFNIMASNQILQLPQKTKLDVYLKQEEQKYIMVDLKYALDNQALTFFKTSVLGYAMLEANVYSEKNQRCPEQFEGDFNFGEVETIIKIDSLKQKLADNQMQDDENIYLCILAKSFTQTKFNIEYTTEDQLIKVLKYDSFQTVTLEANNPKIFQLQAWQYYEVKFTREKGYFYVKLSVCDSVKDGGYEECLDDLKDGGDRGKKIMSKTQQFSQQPCPTCIVYIRLDTDESSELMVHVQSKYSTVELKQKDMISDFTNEGEQNKYSLTSVQSEQTIINIEVTEGDPIVTVTDYGTLSISKQKDPKTNNIHIVIPPVESQSLKSYGGANFYAFDYSYTFRYLALKIKSKDSKLPCSYTISYSSGQSQTYLQSGLLAGYTLDANKLSKFLYRNPNPSQVSKGYMTISMNKSSTLFNLKLNVYTFDDPNDQDTKKEVTVTKPPMRKKTPNPTMTFLLPSSKLVSIQLESAEEAKVTIMINDEQAIMLPFNQDFPFQLMKNEKINLLTDINTPGYLQITLRKCDESQPTFGHTFSYENFQKQEFENSIPLEGDPKFQFIVKASKIGTLYMSLNNNDVANGLFAIKISYSDQKIKGGKMKAGNNGLIQYSLENSKKAVIKFTKVICAASQCTVPIKYYWISGNNLVDVYSQAVCPYSYFLLADMASISPLKINEIKSSNEHEAQITFELPIIKDNSYLSIKAVSGDEQVFYRPIQIVTIWGSLNKSTWMHKLAMVFATSFVLCCLLIIYRRVKNRKQQNIYGVVPDEPDYD